MKASRIVVGTVLVLAACTLPACSNSPRPAVSELKEGLNLLNVKDASWGVNAAFVKLGRVVYFETRVGALKPEIYRLDAPNEPANEMDYRFVDQNNHTFVAVRGGDSWIDPSWSSEIAASQRETVDAALRAQDFSLAKEAAAAFSAATPLGFVDHSFHMKNFALQAVPSADQRLASAALTIAKTPPPAADTGYGSYNSGGWSVFWVGKYSGTTGCNFWTCARHSATDMWSCDWDGSTCNWVRRIVANNHGRGPWDSGMGYDCASQGGWQYNGIDGSTAGGATGSWDGQGGCQTGYSWSSNNYAHLCNDDAAYELWEAKYGPQDNINFWENSSGGWGSGYKDFGNFSCDYPSGDWNTPNCP